MGLFRFLLITIAILWGIRVLFRLLFPVMLRKMANKFQQEATQGYRRQQASRKPEGRISVDYIPPKAKEAKVADKAGDFIDYEEL